MGCGKSKHEVATGNTIAKTKRQKSKHDRSSSQRHEGAKGANPEEVQNREAETKHEIVTNADSRESGDEKKIEPSGQEWINGTCSSGDGMTVEAVISDGISGRTEYYSPNNKNGGHGERVTNRVEEKVSIEYEIREIKNVCN
ncbi:hypothetical protein RHMOL_Rhmol02G0013500 [Rhododendron molle]|uniref:Uncharacterized protein n=1 Tax=Rhododendron molle TaxID=49168 RepID=A0ACC0PLW6_RHOML|nr:hypothetical protein RHMOL_Rhmol02G0013500 [Rhododendron molle]